MPKKLDLTGKQFGRLTVIEPAPNRGKHTMWKCQCECGTVKEISTTDLNSGKTQSCGCLRKEMVAEKNSNRAKDLTNQRFGKLVVKKRVGSYGGRATWLCDCDCGGKKVVRSAELLRGDTLSCGCLRSSIGETKIEEILRDNSIPYKKEYEFKNLTSDKQTPLRYDFAIFNQQGAIVRLVEYDGEQHYLNKAVNYFKKDSLEQRQKRDIQKNCYAIENNIPLVRIPYWEKNNICLDMIMGEQFLIKD